MHNNRQNAPVLSVSPAAAAVWLWSASSEGYPKVRNHGEGPYKGLLLRHYAKQALTPRLKAVVAAFNQEKALVGAFSVIVKTGCGTDGSFYST